MPVSCCAYNSAKRYEKGGEARFYRFPRDPERQRQWTLATKRKDWTPTEHTRICSDHFVKGVDIVDVQLNIERPDTCHTVFVTA